MEGLLYNTKYEKFEIDSLTSESIWFLTFAKFLSLDYEQSLDWNNKQKSIDWILKMFDFSTKDRNVYLLSCKISRAIVELVSSLA